MKSNPLTRALKQVAAGCYGASSLVRKPFSALKIYYLLVGVWVSISGCG